MTTDKILLQTGTFYELYEYVNPIEIGDEKSSTPTKKNSTNFREGINPETVISSTSRAKNKLRRLILGNMWDNTKQSLKFVTLTFKDEIEDIDTANYEFKKFHQRMSYHIGEPLNYIAVPEIQEKRRDVYGKAVWHFHMLTFNQPFLTKTTLHKLWGNGWTDPKRVNRVDGTAKYLTKYLLKAYGNEQLKNRKRYYNALKYQTISYKDPAKITSLLIPMFETTKAVNEYNLYIHNQTGEKVKVGRKREFISK